MAEIRARLNNTSKLELAESRQAGDTQLYKAAKAKLEAEAAAIPDFARRL